MTRPRIDPGSIAYEMDAVPTMLSRPVYSWHEVIHDVDTNMDDIGECCWKTHLNGLKLNVSLTQMQNY